MRFALVQMNPTVGDLAGNAGKIIASIHRAKDAEARVVLLPELALCGYPPKDLLLRGDFLDEQIRQLRRIAAETDGLDVLVGYAERNTAPVGRPLHNAAALLRDGEIVSRHFKTLLPTYDVFDESRYFEPGPNTPDNNVIDACRTGDDCFTLGVTICEDLWNDERLIPRRLYHSNPLGDLKLAGAELIVNLSASPFVAGKHAFRRELFAEQAKKHGVPLLYVNQVGGNDELVFDGNSCAFDANGKLIAHAKAFEDDLLVVDIPKVAASLQTAVEHEEIPDVESIRRALVLGTRDYLHKCGFKKAVIGLSGGIDSAVVAAVATEALGEENVEGVAMPSRYSSGHSVDDARALAENLGIRFHVVPIKPMHDAFDASLGEVFDVTGLTAENLQARIRGATMMAFSNKTGALLLTTGNKSELAVGYCTLYGDMCGGLSVISDVPKTDVYRLARHYNNTAGREVIPENTITKPPSAELAPDQQDSDSLPDYDTLDAILERYIELEEGPDTIVAAGYEREVVEKVVKLVDRSEYKRRQAAPGLKVTSRAFGFGRRMPIAQRFDPLMTTTAKPI
ncbi:MAG: NAD+ synthase [Planctomycetota bacterium]